MGEQQRWRDRESGADEEEKRRGRDETVCRVAFGCGGGLAGSCGSVVCVDGL